MWFGEVPLEEATGAILAHSVSLPQGRLRKGCTLAPDDIAAMRAAGLTVVTVARLEGGDTHEDDAAWALGTALVPDQAAAGLELRAMGTGRVNILATGPGVARVDAAAIGRLNAAHPMITVATVPEWQRMEPGGMVATVKIIAYGVPQVALDKACELGKGALSLARVQRKAVTLIQTFVGEEDGDKGPRVTSARVERLGGALSLTQPVRHQSDDLAAALGAVKGTDLILILTGSATSDIGDTAPEALRRAGGRVVHFGMPVDPGNLLFIGELASIPVIGLPGCARSPALNGADWVLERVMCGVPVGSADIAAMGVGGLLKEIPTRPRPRGQKPPDAAP